MKKLLGLTSLFLVLLCVCACATRPKAIAEKSPCAVPTADSFWSTAEASSVGFAQEKLCDQLQAFSKTRSNIHGILIERHGKLVTEVYRYGNDAPINHWHGFGDPLMPSIKFDENTQHDLRGAGNSIVGLLVGISIDRGTISLTKPFLDYYPDLASYKTMGRENITVRDFLTMTSGLSWGEMGRTSFTSSGTLLAWKENQMVYYFDRKLTSKPGTTFNYSSGSAMALADLLAKENKKTLLQLTTDDLFGPLGITEWEWVSNNFKVPLAFLGLRMRPRDMLKIGRLVNNKGQWNGKQVVPASWIQESISPKVDTDSDLMSVAGAPVSYGYQWWNGSTEIQGHKFAWAAAMGDGGQRIFVVPEMDMTCVITGGDYGVDAIQNEANEIFAGVLAAVDLKSKP